MQRLLQNLMISSACVIVLTAATGVSAGASETLQNPTTGQSGSNVGNSCGTPQASVFPGSAANAPGSPFNSTGQAGVVYAGNPGTASSANSNSTASVSQYDVACLSLSGNH